MRGLSIALMLLVPLGAAQAESQLKIVFTSLMHVDQVPELSEVYMMDPDGSNLVRLTETDGEERWPTPGPDGTLLYWSDDLRRQSNSNPGDVFKMDLHSGQVTEVTPGTGSWNGARLSPGGDKLVVSVHNGDSHFPGRLIVLDLNSGDWTPLLSDSTSALWAGWSPDGTIAEYTTPTGWPSWSPDGTRVAYSSKISPDNWEIDIVDLATGDTVRLTDHDSKDVMPSWSPDGNRIAFVSTRNGGAGSISSSVSGHRFETQGDIFTMDVNGSNMQQITDTITAEVDPRWSPDGRYIAFAGQDDVNDDNWDIYVMNRDGSGRVRLTSDPFFDGYPAWFLLADASSVVRMTSWGELKIDHDPR